VKMEVAPIFSQSNKGHESDSSRHNCGGNRTRSFLQTFGRKISKISIKIFLTPFQAIYIYIRVASKANG